jgi:flagellar hook-associated protein 1 FlgK
MSSLFTLLGTMGNALSAQQAGLATTGQNVSNVNTPGYVQRTAILQSQAVMPGDQGGVTVAGIQRNFDTFTFTQVMSQQGLKSAADARSQALSGAESIVAPTGGGSIGDQMTSFFSSLQSLSANPSDPSARSAVLTQATNLAQSFATTAQGLQQTQGALFTQAQGATTTLNSDLTKIAQLNSQISQATAVGDQAPDLRDQRDSLVNDVSSQIGASVVEDPSGSVTLFAAGTALVSGDKAQSLGLSLDTSGAMKFTVTQPGGAPADVTSAVTGGTLGGIREARDTDIAQTASQLDQLAYNFSNAVNAVHQSGYGLDGVSGRPLFTPPTQVAGAAAAMSVDPSVDGQPNNVAASSTAADVPGGNGAVLQLEALANQGLAGGGTPASQFGSIAAGIGNASSAAATDASTRADTLSQAQNLNSSASGVSLNEEMVKMTQFQQAFDAATRVLQVTSDLLGNFITTMSSGG